MASEREVEGLEGVRLLNVRQAARLLGTTPGRLYSMVWKRRIVFTKIGRSVRFDIRDLEKMIQDGKVMPLELPIRSEMLERNH